MTSQSFSFSRLTVYFQHELEYNAKKFLLYFGIIAGTLLLIGIFNYFQFDRAIEDSYSGELDPTLHSIVQLYSIFLVAFGCMSASLMWNEMKTKQGRLSVLMTPASAIEKFIVKISIYIILFIIVYIFAVIIAESIRYLILYLIYPDSAVVPLYLSGRFNETDNQYIWDIFGTSANHPIWILVMVFLIIQSFFVLGASIWYSKSFIKTFLALGILIITFYFFTGGCFELFINHKRGDPPGPFYWLQNHAYISFTVFAALVTIINWTLACCRFTETEIITIKK